MIAFRFPEPARRLPQSLIRLGVAKHCDVSLARIDDILFHWSAGRDTLQIGAIIKADEDVVYNVLHAYREMRRAA